MAKSPSKMSDFILQLPLETKVDVFKVQGKETTKETMTYGESLKLKNAPDVKYWVFQEGFGQMKATKTIE